MAIDDGVREATVRRKLYRVLTEKRFARWLRAHRKDEIVGEAGHPKCCPLANYLSECGFSRPDVIPGLSVSIEMPNGEEREFDTPEWADEFAHHIDCRTKDSADDDDPPGTRYIADEDGRVTAREALSVLEGRW